MKPEVVQETVKTAPAVAGAVWSALTLNQLVALATLIYIVLQAAYLARKWWREEQESAKP